MPPLRFLLSLLLLVTTAGCATPAVAPIPTRGAEATALPIIPTRGAEATALSLVPTRGVVRLPLVAHAPTPTHGAEATTLSITPTPGIDLVPTHGAEATTLSIPPTPGADLIPTLGAEATALVPTPTPEPTATPILPSIDRIEFGIAAHLFYVNRELPLQRAQEAGFGWIRQQIHWRDIEGPPGRYGWSELDKIVGAVQAYRFKLMISVVRSPPFYTADGSSGLPADTEAFGRFAEALAARYRGQIHAIEIWNEQNLAHETGGRITLDDAGRYVELLKAAYPRIKAVDPSIVVLAGAPSSTGVTDPAIAVDDQRYYAAMYAYQGGVIRDYFDAQAVHPGGAANPPETLWPENPSTADGWTDHPTFYFRHVEHVRRLMEQAGLGEKPIWITEFGWATRNTTPGYEFGNQVSLDQQAQYLAGAMRLAYERYPWIGAMFVWNLNFAILRTQSGQPLHEQASYAILNGNGAPRPAWNAIREFLGEVGYR